jgi:hypothetical protein
MSNKRAAEKLKNQIFNAAISALNGNKVDLKPFETPEYKQMINSAY